MAQTIESFVQKLQADGVQAGRQEAEQLLAEARTQAEMIVAEARKQAEKTAAEAQRQAEDLRARAATDLNLACRDAVLKLQETLGRGLSALLAHKAGEVLAETDFVGRLLHEVVLLYAKADCSHKELIEINVAPEKVEALAAWALREIGQSIDGHHPCLNLRGTLADSGFEYKVAGSTVEVTAASAAETLMGLVGPRLRKTLEQAVGDGNGKPGQSKG